MKSMVYPSPDLMTRRDASLLLLYADKIHSEFAEQRRSLSELRASLIDEKARIENGKPPANPTYESWTVGDAERAILSCESQETGLAATLEDKLDRVMFVLAKREGFKAGLRFASLALRDYPTNGERLNDVVCALADDDIADDVLHQFTRDMPDPYTDGPSFFPLSEPPASLVPEIAADKGVAK